VGALPAGPGAIWGEAVRGQLRIQGSRAYKVWGLVLSPRCKLSED